MKQRNLNIFCPRHHIRLPVVGPGVLSCDNGPHVLAEDFPLDFLKYCCECDTFSPLENDKGCPYDHCSSCKRELEDYWYLCENCGVFTMRARAEAPRNKIYLPPQGKGPPQPFCPGCELGANFQLREHFCNSLFDMEAGVSVITPRSSCPLCKEKIPLAIAGGTTGEETLPGARPGGYVTPWQARRDDASVAAPDASFWRRMKEQWLNGPVIVGTALALMSLFYAAFAYAFPTLPANVYWHYKRLAVNRPPVMKLADPLHSKHEVQENEDVVLTATAVEPDGDDFIYVWEVVLSNARIVDDGKPEVTLKTTGLRPVSQPLRIVVRVKARDSYGAESNVREIELFVTTPNLAKANAIPVISDLTCGCANWEARAGDRVVLNAAVSDPDGDELIYDWHTDPPGLIVGNGPSVLLDTSFVRPKMLASVVVSLTAIDGRGGVTTKERILNVFSQLALQTPAPTPSNNDPSVKLLPPVGGTLVRFGDKVTLTAIAQDQDNDKLMYEWKTSTGLHKASDSATFTFNVDSQDSPVVVDVTVKDMRGGICADKLLIEVRPPDPKPTPAPTSQPSPTPASTPAAPTPQTKAGGGRRPAFA